MSTPMIQISNLMKSYKLGGETVHALNNVFIRNSKRRISSNYWPSGQEIDIDEYDWLP